MVRRVVAACGLGVLVLALSAEGKGVELLPDRLSVDAVVASDARWWQVQERGLTNSGFTVDRVLAPVGLTGLVGVNASLRASCDLGLLQPQDVYVDLQWPSGFGLRAGQFKLPVGMEQMSDLEEARLVNSPLLAWYAYPVDARDVGLAGSWTGERLGLTTAVVAGNGPNTLDNNHRNDLCGRVVFTPDRGRRVELAGRGYLGWPDPAKPAWQTAALEARVAMERVTLWSELQSHASASRKNNAGYLQLGWDSGVVEPVCRFDLVLPQGAKPEFWANVGTNLRPLSGHLKFMLSGTYIRNFESGVGVLIVFLRLQAVL